VPEPSSGHCILLHNIRSHIHIQNSYPLQTHPLAPHGTPPPTLRHQRTCDISYAYTSNTMFAFTTATVRHANHIHTNSLDRSKSDWSPYLAPSPHLGHMLPTPSLQTPHVNSPLPLSVTLTVRICSIDPRPTGRRLEELTDFRRRARTARALL
jgi:hypothetical protein